MKTQKDYWEHHILDWESAAFGEQTRAPLSLVERVAQRFRGPIRHRQMIAMETLRRVRPTGLLELGCASGRFSTAAAQLPGMTHVTGVDISSEAIAAAQARAAAMQLSGRVTFLASSIAALDFASLPRFDFVVGLGLTPYLNDEEFSRLFTAIAHAGFLFDVHPTGWSVSNAAHAVYRSIKGHPFYYRYSRADFLARLERHGITGVSWKQSEGVTYVERLPASRSHGSAR